MGGLDAYEPINQTDGISGEDARTSRSTVIVICTGAAIVLLILVALCACIQSKVSKQS